MVEEQTLAEDLLETHAMVGAVVLLTLVKEGV